jgi:hypothetical protein
MSNFLALRQQRQSIASDVPYQFPDIYRHYHPRFVEFVKAYYDAIEDTRDLRFRDAKIHRNVDDTYYEFLNNFRNKYLADFPSVDDDTTRFIIKHIKDLYKRKGTEESIRMLFRLFYGEEIEVNYPGKLVFKSSDSVYKTSNYIEMKPVNTSENYPIYPGTYIKGDVSKAKAYVDSVVFKTFQGAIVPVVYISNLVGGEFLKDDSITIETFEGTLKNVGRLIQGSISSLEILPGGRSDENKEGDTFDVISETGGIVGRVIATKIEELETGSIDFSIVDKGYGYTYLEENYGGIPTPEGTALIDDNKLEKNDNGEVIQSILSRGTTQIPIRSSTFSAKNAQSLRYAIKFETEGKLYNRESYYDIVAVTGAGGFYTVTLAKGLEEDVPVEATTIEFYNYAHYSDIVTSNQTFVLDTDISDLLESATGELKEDADPYTIKPENFNALLSDKIVAVGSLEPEAAFAESVALTEYLNKFEAYGIAEVLSYEEPLLYVNSNEQKFEFKIKEDSKTPYEYYDSVENPDIVYAVGDFVVYEGVTYECIRAHIPQPQLNPVYFRLPILDRIPDNARMALQLYRAGELIGKVYVNTMSPYNNSASFRISALENSENLRVITDRISTTLNTPINSANFPLSGKGGLGVNLSTKLSEAFEPVDLTIGEVSKIDILNNGANFENDIKSVVRQNFIYQRNRKDLIISFEDQVEIWNATTFDPIYPSEDSTNQRNLAIRNVTKDIFNIFFNREPYEITIDLEDPEVIKRFLEAWLKDKIEQDGLTSDLEVFQTILRTATEKQLAVLSIKQQLDDALENIVSPAVRIQPNGLEFSIGTIDDYVELPKANIAPDDPDQEYQLARFDDYFNMLPGEKLIQIIKVNDIVFQTDAYRVSIEFIKSYSNRHYFRQTSYYPVDAEVYFVHPNRPSVRYKVSSVELDEESNAMGNNALVNGSVYFARGQLQNVEVINSGYRYRNDEIVKLVNTKTGEIAARAIIKVSGTGVSEGEWITFSSFTSDPTAISYLHDNDYYQEFSYDISSIINTEKYAPVVKDLVQPVGTKQFNTPFINSRNKIEMNVDVALEVYDLSEEIIEAEGSIPEGQGIGAVDANGNVIGELVAVIATLDDEAGTQI